MIVASDTMVITFIGESVRVKGEMRTARVNLHLPKPDKYGASSFAIDTEVDCTRKRLREVAAQLEVGRPQSPPLPCSEDPLIMLVPSMLASSTSKDRESEKRLRGNPLRFSKVRNRSNATNREVCIKSGAGAVVVFAGGHWGGSGSSAIWSVGETTVPLGVR
jgi:hypothetical protein